MTEAQRMPHIFIAGQFPPPVNGFSFITQEMAKRIRALHPVTFIDLSPHRKRGGVLYHFQRMGLTLRGLWPLLRQAMQYSARALYIACEGDWGLVYTLVLSAAARLLRTPIFIHHHSFSYIEKHSALMSCLVFLAGQKATHIFLCQTMADRFQSHYCRAIQSKIISNSAFVETGASVPATGKASRPLVIGLLSNLNEAKGLGLFLDLLRGAAKEKLDITAVLAGPTDGEADRAAIKDAGCEPGIRLDYRGALYGDAKNRFFDSIDVFVFPTLYANEAQPAVIYEAMARGIPVLSYDRGCILSQVGRCGAVQARDADFILFALDWLKARLADPASLVQLKLDALQSFKEDRAIAQRQVAALFNPL